MRQYFEKLYAKSASDFHEILSENLQKNEKMFIVTANPETFTFGEKEETFHQLLMDKDTTIVPDGISIVKAAHILKYSITERIPGIEIAIRLLELANEYQKKVYLYGSSAEVILAMEDVMKNKYPNATLVGSKNGYGKDKDSDFEEIIALKPDIVLVALGIPAQEKLIYKHLRKAKKGIFVGVGGSFDVMSGLKKRAPKFFQKFGLEWLYRIAKEPKRLKRFYQNNVSFLIRIMRKKI